LADIFRDMVKTEDKIMEKIAFIVFALMVCMFSLATFRVSPVIGILLSVFCVGFWIVFFGVMGVLR
jgi:Ca2+/Na+ antiporter